MTNAAYYSLFANVVYEQNGPFDTEAYIKKITNGTATKVGSMDKPDWGSGLYAEAWEVNNEIIISIRGTNFSSLSDWVNNIALGTTLFSSVQWNQLQDFIEQIETKYHNTSSITFAGHSLGGGLATLASLKYGYPAYTFAPAPFKLTAANLSFIPVGLAEEHAITLRAAANMENVSNEALEVAIAAKQALMDAQMDKIRAYSVEGEVLQYLDLGFNGFPTGAGNVLDIGESGSGLGTGWLSGVGDAVARHSMNLHMVLLNSPSFQTIMSTNDSIRKFVLNGWFGPENSDGGVDINILLRAMLFANDFEKMKNPWFASLDLNDFIAAITIKLLSAQIDSGLFAQKNNSFKDVYGSNDIGWTYDLTDINANLKNKIYPNGLSDESYILSKIFQTKIEEHYTSGGMSELDSKNIAIKAAISSPIDYFHINSPIDESKPIMFFDNKYDGKVNFIWINQHEYSSNPRDIMIELPNGENYYYGSNGRDHIIAGVGKDVVFGGVNGTGFSDTINYSRSTAGVEVNIDSTSPQSGGYAAGDILIGIENIVGSHFDDILISSYSGSLINAGSGDDYIVAKGNNQSIFWGIWQ